ncbi:MAG TPA: S8 family serine peptidase, partial [Verrucomicrobiae bacterium]|nr:S8 family serine peptidase [Verrucomicrobiae bacterium]
MTLELETPSRKLTCRAVCVCVVLACVWQAGAQVHPTGQSAQEEPRNIRVSDPALSKELAARGAELVADYQSFRVYRVDATSARALSRRDGVQTLRHANVIELNSGFLDTMLPSVKASRQAVKADANKHLRLVQFAGPVKPEWLNALESTGARVVAYVPHNAFLVYGTGTVLGRMQSWAASSTAVQWEGDYKPEYKVHPNARRSVKAVRGLNQTNALFSLQLIDDPAANPSTLALARSFAGSRIRKQWRSLGYLNVIALLPWDAVTRLAAQPEVVSIHRYIEPVKLDERQDQIVAGNLSGTAPSGPGYLAWLSSKGFSQSQFDASGFSVDVSDSGIDNGTTLPNHFGLYTDADTNQASRVIYNRVEGTPNENSKLEGCDGHGNLNAHIIAGFNDEPSAFPHTDPQGYHYGLGVCPFVSVGSSVIFDPNYFTYPDYAALQSEAYQDGARVSNNSWGAGMAGDYTVDCQTFDALVRDAQPDTAPFTNAGNQEMVIVFSSGNNGPGPQTVTSPGSAKNVITVGAAESVRSLSIANGGNDAAGSDGCALNDTNADSADDLTSFSSRGPCTDGRQKPDL